MSANPQNPICPQFRIGKGRREATGLRGKVNPKRMDKRSARPGRVPLAIPALALLAAASVACADTPRTTSPDGRFYFEIAATDADDSFAVARVVAKSDGQVVWQTPEDARNSFSAESACVWSPDSKRFALNWRAGGRYETADVFRWDGKAFVPSPSLEKFFAPRLEAAKEKELRELEERLPDFPDKQAVLRRSQRRIWDNVAVRRWIDNNTLEATGYSIRFVTPGLEENDGEDISGALRLVMRSDAHGRWKILKEESIPLEKAEAAQR